MTRDITIVTGTRADPLESTMAAIADHEELSLSVVATGTHLSPGHGRTVDEIREQGFPVDREINMLLEDDSGKAMAKSTGIALSSFAEAFDSLTPDVVVVTGDRFEDIAAAIAGAFMNIPVAHIHGGDVVSGAVIDDSIRHAITKFAHVHFPATERSAENIRRLGEEPWRIEVVGTPGLDCVTNNVYTDHESVLLELDLDPSERTVVVLQHPLTTDPDAASGQMKTTLSALEEFDGNVVVVYSNADAGGKRMIDVIEEWRANSETEFANIRVVESLPRREYLGLLSGADVLLGNSSSGLVEAPSFGTPVVDIGPRQTGRERSENVFTVDHNREDIATALETALEDEFFRETARKADNPYYRGGAGPAIAEFLSELELSTRLLQKRTTFSDDEADDT